MIDPGRKKYSVLSTIERMYDYLLELEDLERMLLIVPAEERSKIIDAKNEVADRMFSCFCISDSGSVASTIIGLVSAVDILFLSDIIVHFQHAKRSYYFHFCLVFLVIV